MKPSIEQVQSLLSLKRHERPPEGYMDEFLREFHMRRREEAVSEKRLGVLWSRFNGWFAEPGMSKWVYGGVVAYAVVMIAFMTGEGPLDVEGLNATPVKHQILEPVEPAVQQLEGLDLRPSSLGGSGD